MGLDFVDVDFLVLVVEEVLLLEEDLVMEDVLEDIALEDDEPEPEPG